MPTTVSRSRACMAVLQVGSVVDHLKHPLFTIHSAVDGQAFGSMAAEKKLLPDEVLKMIHGQVPHEDKKQQYQESLQK